MHAERMKKWEAQLRELLVTLRTERDLVTSDKIVGGIIGFGQDPAAQYSLHMWIHLEVDYIGGKIRVSHDGADLSLARRPSTTFSTKDVEEAVKFTMSHVETWTLRLIGAAVRTQHKLNEPEVRDITEPLGFVICQRDFAMMLPRPPVFAED